jgi:aspartate racemase
MITETTSYIHKTFPDMKKIGLLATTGTIMTRLYHDAINGIEIITPDKELQEKVMNSIYGEEGIKAGYTEGSARDDILDVIEVLIKKGAEAIILGCTELTLLSLKEDVPVPLVDPSQILAEVVVKKARLQI